MYLAGVSMRRVKDITEALWGTQVSASAVSGMAQKVYGQIEAWRSRKLTGEYAYVYLRLYPKLCQLQGELFASTGQARLAG